MLGLAQIAARPRHRATVAILFTIATIASIVVPIWLRAGSVRPRPNLTARSSINPEGVSGDRVVLLCLDGASLDVISPAVAAGRLPNFGRLLDGGASMHLATTRPTQPEPVWASVMTGMWPSHHGVRGSARYRPFNGDVTVDVLPDYLFRRPSFVLACWSKNRIPPPVLATQPLWRIAAGYGVPTGLIGLPLTHPATGASGFIISDRFHRRADRVVTLDGEPAVSPSRLGDVALGVLAETTGPRAARATRSAAVDR